VAATLAARNVDGVIIAALVRENLRALRVPSQKRIPFVCLARSVDQLHGDFVGIDFDAAATLLVEHVLSHGYRDIATVIGSRFSTASLIREQAFVRTAAAAGVAIQSTRKTSTRHDSARGGAAAKSLLAGARPRRAVACGSAEIAVGVMEHAMSIGLRTPEDLAVFGGDGLPHSRSALIARKAVIQPINVMAEWSVELLLDQITRPRSTYHHVICEHRLQIGRTCGCPPVRQDTAHCSPNHQPITRGRSGRASCNPQIVHRRIDRQHVLGGSPTRDGRAQSVLGVQVRGHRVHQIVGNRAGRLGYPRQRHLPRSGRRAPDRRGDRSQIRHARQAGGRGGGPLPRPVLAGAPGVGHRHRRHGRLPGHGLARNVNGQAMAVDGCTEKLY
jgi:Periplasmic binding protein-like domain